MKASYASFEANMDLLNLFSIYSNQIVRKNLEINNISYVVTVWLYITKSLQLFARIIHDFFLKNGRIYSYWTGIRNEMQCEDNSFLLFKICIELVITPREQNRNFVSLYDRIPNAQKSDSPTLGVDIWVLLWHFWVGGDVMKSIQKKHFRPLGTKQRVSSLEVDKRDQSSTYNVTMY